MTVRRGWILLKTGRTVEVPDSLLDEEEITWPPALLEKALGEGVHYISEKDFYQRHELIEGEAFVYLAHDRKVPHIEPETIENLLSRTRIVDPD